MGYQSFCKVRYMFLNDYSHLQRTAVLSCSCDSAIQDTRWDTGNRRGLTSHSSNEGGQNQYEFWKHPGSESRWENFIRKTRVCKLKVHRMETLADLSLVISLGLGFKSSILEKAACWLYVGIELNWSDRVRTWSVICTPQIQYAIRRYGS